MSLYDEIMGVFSKCEKFVFECMHELKAEVTKEMDWLDSIENHIEEFHRTGILPQLIGVLPQAEQMETVDQPTKEDTLKQPTVLSSPTNSLKENVQSNHQTTYTTRVTRQMKNSILTNTLQQHDNFMNNLQVKQEKISECFIGVVKEAVTNINVKEEMLPPRKPPVRNTRKKKAMGLSVQVKSELIDEQLKQREYLDDSDVQIQKQMLDVIDLEDTLVEQEPIKATRSRTKVRKPTESKEESQSDIESRNTRVLRTKRNNNTDIENHTSVPVNETPKNRSTNRNSEKTQNEDVEEPQSKKRKVNEESNHFDAPTSTPVSAEVPRMQLNETQIINKPTLLNETVTLEKNTGPKKITDLNDIMTEDEDIVDCSPPKSKRHKKQPVFSPYENSPVKKRVQAFEKLGAATETTTKLTRPKVVKQPSFEDLKKYTPSTQKLRDFPRLAGTPLTENKFKQLQPSSTSKLVSSIPIASYNMSNKAGSGIKTSGSKMEFHERELRRKQKEIEALQKKEALILAQTEEKRKKREEREMKVQRHLETAERVKDEKLKQMLAEKEAKFMRQKEEAAKKRAAAAKKALEVKQRVLKHKNFIPPYFKYETPLLPTPDCYDSDDSSSKGKIKVPSWQKHFSLSQALQAMQFLESHKKSFFLSGPRTPNLQDIFPTIEPAKLKRTSSAIWNKTEMSVLENLTDED